MEIRFDNKKVLVVGASRDIGRVLVENLVEYGAEVHALARNKPDLDKLVADFPKVHPIHVDLFNWDATRKAVQEIEVLDMLVHNAGGSHFGPKFLDTTKEEFVENFDIDVLAAANVGQVVAKKMIDRGQGGSIVHVSSVSTLLPLAGFSAYNISKAGLDMLTKSMANELGPNNIRVNAVNLTNVNTPGCIEFFKTHEDPWKHRHPFGRYVDIDEAVNTILFLLSDKSSYTSGVCLPVDGALICS